MAKKIDLSMTVHDLVKKHPELKDVMKQIGFTDIAKPAALKTVGRVMTIPKGCAVKGFELADVVAQLEAAGFTCVEGTNEPAKGDKNDKKSKKDKKDKKDKGEKGKKKSNKDKKQKKAKKGKYAEKGEQVEQIEKIEEGVSKPEPASTAEPAAVEAQPSRTEQLKGYVRRLTEGESLESVRAEFVEEFQDVDASEIMDAEQQLLAEGAPLDDVTRLCDVHSALFHGMTGDSLRASEEAGQARISSALERAEAQLQQQEAALEHEQIHASAAKGEATAAALEAVPGHPLNVFHLENEAVTAQVARVREALAAGDDAKALDELQTLRAVAGHYRKKGDLLMPLLKTRYGISGPSDVMWTVDIEIREEMRALAAAPSAADWHERMDAVLNRVDEMVFKEENILFPLCATNFTEAEWDQLARDLGDYDLCLIDEVPAWKGGAATAAQPEAATADEVVLPSGHMTVAQLTALLNTIPGEITFVDSDNMNRYFNEGEKYFKRPSMALDREVFSCHPPKVEAIVRQLIQSFRDGEESSFDVWHNKGGHDVLVRYLAVRDADGTYVGTLEYVQDLTFAREHFVTPQE